MTDSKHSLDEVPALLEERRRYETWLGALDARRDTTAVHVFERVHADYRSRLDQVAARLATYHQAMEEERTNLQSRLSLLDAEERMRRDERAELDLRAHVGELAASDATEAFAAVDYALEQLVDERKGLQRRIDELAALLAEQTPVAAAPTVSLASPAQQSATETPPADDSRTPGGSFDEMAFLDAVVGHDAAASGGDQPVGTVRGSTSESTGVVPSSQGPRHGPSNESAVVRDDPDAESLLAGLGDSAVRASNEPPLASNVPANTPIVLRASGAIEQSKTLKCNECGAMNYPTEWYCERCGAELAAL